MDEGAAIRRHCNDDPDDEVRRWVYADWLEENGRQQDAEAVRRARPVLVPIGYGGGGSYGGYGGGGDYGYDGGGGGGYAGGGGGGYDGYGGGGGGDGLTTSGELRMFEVGEKLLVIVRSGYDPAVYAGRVEKTLNGGMSIVLRGVMCHRLPGGDWQSLANGNQDCRREAQYKAGGGVVRIPEVARAHEWVGELPTFRED